MSASVELRLIGSPEAVAATVEWLQAHGLAIERDRAWPSRKTKGDVCRYMDVVVPGGWPKTAAGQRLLGVCGGATTDLIVEE